MITSARLGGGMSMNHRPRPGKRSRCFSKRRCSAGLRLSGYYLMLVPRQTYGGMIIAIPAQHWVVFRRLSDAPLARVLRELAGQVKLALPRAFVWSQEEAAGSAGN